MMYGITDDAIFLSSNAQDFIEDRCSNCPDVTEAPFLSSNAQDFIEDATLGGVDVSRHIPEQ